MRVAQHVARTAKLKICLGDFGAVQRPPDNLKALRGDGIRLGPGNQERPRLRAASAHAAAQLVQLGQTKAVGIEDDDAAGLPHIHADLDHRGGHQHRRLAGCKRRHHASFRLVVIAAGQRGESYAPELRQGGQTPGDLGHGMQRGPGLADLVIRQDIRPRTVLVRRPGLGGGGNSVGGGGVSNRIVVRIDARADHIRPFPGIDPSADMLKHPGHRPAIRLRDHHRADRFAAAGQLGQP